MKKGILLCGHGSRTKTGTDAFKELIDILKKRYTDYEVDYGFLEFNHPLYEAAVERLYQKRGKGNICLANYFICWFTCKK